MGQIQQSDLTRPLGNRDVHTSGRRITGLDDLEIWVVQFPTTRLMLPAVQQPVYGGAVSLRRLSLGEEKGNAGAAEAN